MNISEVRQEKWKEETVRKSTELKYGIDFLMHISG